MTKKVTSPKKPTTGTVNKPSSSVKLTPKKSTVDVSKPTSTKSATVAIAAKPVESKAVLKKGELVDRVVEQTGVKKRDAKTSVEAALAVLADALKSDTDLNLPPMGKVRLVKSKEVGDGAKVLTLKLRTMKLKASTEES